MSGKNKPKKKKFKVEVTEKTVKTYYVTALDEEEAEELVCNGDIEEDDIYFANDEIEVERADG